MKKTLFAFIAALLIATGALASSGHGVPLDQAPPYSKADMASLQRGAKLFVNYCYSCHSAAFVRYNRLQDLDLTQQQIKEHLLVGTEKVGDLMKANIDPRQAKEWFGANPPDLTLMTRSRSSGAGTGADYVYTYLRSYYRDDTRATGWNNLVFPNVGMPHVLWELQGERKPVYVSKESHGHKTEVFDHWEQVTPGKLTTLEYDQAVADLVGYMQWMAEPTYKTRIRVGVGVLLFLLVFTFVTWRLNASFWKDVK